MASNPNTQEWLTLGFSMLGCIQADVSESGGENYSHPTNTQITRTSFALVGEVFELAQELGWKNWKEAPEMIPEQVAKVAEEFADVVAFFSLLMNLVMARTGLTYGELAAAYLDKSETNKLRLSGRSDEPGYEGVELDE